MMYNINSQYGGRVSHPKYMTDNSVICIKVDYVTEGIDVTVHNVNREVI